MSRRWPVYLLVALVATAVLALVLATGPRPPRVLPLSAGMKVFQPGELRPGDRVTCPGNGSVVVPARGQVAGNPAEVSAQVEADGAVFTVCGGLGG